MLHNTAVTKQWLTKWSYCECCFQIIQNHGE